MSGTFAGRELVDPDCDGASEVVDGPLGDEFSIDGERPFEPP
jgi:hypothetical protein